MLSDITEAIINATPARADITRSFVDALRTFVKGIDKKLKSHFPAITIALNSDLIIITKRFTAIIITHNCD